MNKQIKPIMYYHVDTSNKGDWAIKKSITEAIKERIDVPFSYFNVKTDELTEERILNQLNPNCSALMIAGSGLYTNYPKSSGWYFPCKTELFEKINVPIMLIGLGNNQNLKGNILNTELKEETKKSIKLINKLSYISSVRDSHTFDLLLYMGIKNHKLQLDPGNFLRVPKVPKEKKVAINIAQHAPILGRFDGGEEGQKNRQKNISNFVQISGYLKRMGYKTVFIAHDALESSIIKDMLQYIPDMEYLNTDSLDEMLLEYAKCSFSICTKMHSAIMSFASGTPAINVYYDKKSVEYLKMINFPELGVNIFNDYYDELQARVNLMLSASTYYTSLITTIKRMERTKFDNLMDKACNIIKEV